MQKESKAQDRLFTWAKFATGQYPELEFLYHVPNGGSRNSIEGANLKKQGVKRGVPDIQLDVSRCGYHGLRIELKTTKGKVSTFQREWLSFLSYQGYYATVCYGWEQARNVIIDYLEGSVNLDKHLSIS